MPGVLITGSNRGLGLEWAGQFAQLGWRVHATCRRPGEAVKLARLAEQHAEVQIHRLDVTHAHEIDRVSARLDGEPIDLLINNAGIYIERWGKDPLGAVDYRAWQESFRVNTLGAMRITEALVAHLARGERRLVVTITSHMGSIADITSARDYAYRSSKAALNAAMKGLSLELRPQGIGVLLLHPGWVRTRMGGRNAPLTPRESVEGMRAIVDRFDLSLTGQFFRYDGSPLPW